MANLPHTRFFPSKPLSPAQLKMLVSLAAGEAVGHHDWRIIQALAYRGLVVGPKRSTPSGAFCRRC
jgi:hypothetical protein